MLSLSLKKQGADGERQKKTVEVIRIVQLQYTDYGLHGYQFKKRFKKPKKIYKIISSGEYNFVEKGLCSQKLSVL